MSVLARLTVPLLPADYLGYVDPLNAARSPRARVEAVVRETADAATLVLRPGRGLAAHQPGQWVRVGVEVDGVLLWRSYSLTSVPRDPLLSITVRAQGPVSRQLVRGTRPGSVLRVEGPQGEFVLPARVPGPLLLVAAGSGITPLMSMLRTLARRRALDDVVVHHSGRTPDGVVFGTELRALARAFPGLHLVEHHTAVGRRMTVADLPADWDRRDTWACGPAALLTTLESHWADHGDPALLRVERFQTAVAAEGTGGGAVTFARSGRRSDGAATLLAAGEEAGVLMPHGCRMGICHTCVVPLLSGQVRDVRTGAVQDTEGALVQTCVSAAAGPVCLDV